MRLRILLRLSLTIIFGFVGSLIARGATPPEIFGIFGKYFLIFAVGGFGLLGLIFPDLVELAGKAGLAVLAKHIVTYVPEQGGKFRAKIRLSRRSRKGQKIINPLVLDTSALIDGRVVDIVKTGFIFGTFLVIPSVIDELHKLADSASDLKRIRGRRGLDCLKSIQQDKNVTVKVLDAEPVGREVDRKLVELARKLKGKVVTVDYNLNKVAKIRGVGVLNINELANAVKTAVLPNERLDIQLNSKGKEKNQGVGYLAAGTMA